MKNRAYHGKHKQRSHGIVRENKQQPGLEVNCGSPERNRCHCGKQALLAFGLLFAHGWRYD